MERRQDDIARDMQESDQAFRAQFDPSDPQYHQGISTPVPVGGARVPASMPTEIDPNYAPPAEPDTPEYLQTKNLRTRLGEFKKDLAKCSPLVEIRVHIADIPEEAKRNELYDRNDGEVAVFEAKIREYVDELSQAGSLLHVNYRHLVDDLTSNLRARYDNKEAFAPLAHKLKEMNSKVFKDMTDLLQRMKQLKKQGS